MVEIPATKTVNRREASKNVNDDEEVNSFGANLSETFELRRSGRQMRRVEGAPPIHLRNWKAPIPSTSSTGKAFGSCVQNRKLTIAETVYVFKPIVHLSSVASFGLSSWKSYGISLLMDAYRYFLKNRFTNINTICSKLRFCIYLKWVQIYRRKTVWISNFISDEFKSKLINSWVSYVKETANKGWICWLN